MAPEIKNLTVLHDEEVEPNLYKIEGQTEPTTSEMNAVLYYDEKPIKTVKVMDTGWFHFNKVHQKKLGEKPKRAKIRIEIIPKEKDDKSEDEPDTVDELAANEEPKAETIPAKESPQPEKKPNLPKDKSKNDRQRKLRARVRRRVNCLEVVDQNPAGKNKTEVLVQATRRTDCEDSRFYVRPLPKARVFVTQNGTKDRYGTEKAVITTDEDGNAVYLAISNDGKACRVDFRLAGESASNYAATDWERVRFRSN